MNALVNIAERLTWLALVPAVVLAAWVWTGPAWALWAAAAVAILSARRELSGLYLRPLPPAVREALLAGPEEAVEGFRELARQSGIVSPAVLYWPQEDFPHGAPAAYYLVQGRPIFLLNEAARTMLSPAEGLAAFAHELAHHLLGHVKRFALAKVLADAGGAGAACAALAAVPTLASWLRPTAPSAAAPAAAAPAFAGGLSWWPLAATVLAAWLIARAGLLVALNAYSRRQELQADRKALALTGDRAAMAGAYRKLAAWRGAEGEPPRWWRWFFADSPSLRQRLAQIEGEPRE